MNGDSIAEKRVFDDRSGAVDAYVASPSGVLRVRIAGGTVGEFGLVTSNPARDVAVSEAGTLSVATADGVLVARSPTANGSTGDSDASAVAESTDAPSGGPSDKPIDARSFENVGLTGAVATGFDGNHLLSATDEGSIGRYREKTDEWDALEPVPKTSVSAIDGTLVGTADGVYLVRGDRLTPVGLTAVRDVSTPGAPLAATDTGLYRLGNGWMSLLEGAFDAVAADPTTEPGQLDHVVAASDRTVYAFVGTDDSDTDGGDCVENGADPGHRGAWVEYTASAPIAGLAFTGSGGDAIAVTEDGTVLVRSGADWRSRSIGVTGVTGLAVTPVVADHDRS